MTTDAPITRPITRVALAVIGFCAAYLVPSYARAPNLFYDPLAHRWLFGASPGPIPLGYVGMCLYGIVGALVGAAIAQVLPARLSLRTVALLAAWTIAALWLTLAYFVWSLWPF